jgi:hypothetical protein
VTTGGAQRVETRAAQGVSRFDPGDQSIKKEIS